MVATFSLAGCKEEEAAVAEEEEAAETTQEKKITIGRILIYMVDDYQQTAARCAQEFCDKNNIELMLSSADSDVEKERTIIEDLITSNVDAIIIQPMTPVDANEMKKLANDAGIPIVFFFEAPSEEPYVYLTVTEEEQNVELGAACAELWLENHPDVPIVVGALGMKELEFAMKTRHDTFIKGVKSVYPDAEIIEIALTSESSLELVQLDFEDAILAHPEINIVCAMDAAQCLTAHNVLKSIDRGTIETEVVGGIQGSLEEYLRMQDPMSSYRFSVGLKPYDYEMRLFDIALKMISGEIPIDANERFTEESILITGDFDWSEYLEKQWGKNLEEELEKLKA